MKHLHILKFCFSKTFPLILAFTLLIGISPSVHAMVDQNGNGISDVWEWIYGAYGIAPGVDSDGDGFSNLQESIAGTNPFNSNSFPQISISVSGSNVNVTMGAALGKFYQLESAPQPTNGQWLQETNIICRSGSNVVLSVPVSAVSKFYRVWVADVDTDGDGLNDWEEYQLGLDPLNPTSNNQQDSNGNTLTDYGYAVAKLAQQNVVTIFASDDVTTQPDPGQPATDLAVFTVTRGGFGLDAITVKLAVIGTNIAGAATMGLDYSNLPVSITLPIGVTSTNINLTPLANTNLVESVVATLSLATGTGYIIGTASNASVVIYPSITQNGTGLVGQYYTNSSTTYTNVANFNPTNLFLTRVDPVVDFNWTNGLTPNLSNGYYTVRWTGQVRPQYSETYVFDVYSDDGVRLWVNDQLIINKWQSQSVTDQTNAITLQAGVRYDLKLEYLQAGATAQAHLSWYSPSQLKQVIPNSALYPTNSVGGSNSLSAVTSALTAVGYLGQPFTYTISGANTPLGFTAAGLPPGLTLNSTNGIISGIPALAGTFQGTVTSSNALGVGASVLSVVIFNTGSAISQEVWTNVPGTNVADIPTSLTANFTNALGTLEGITDYGDNYGERIRGYITVPATGNYYFWIAGSDSAQLWISDDGDPVNKILRASVFPTPNPNAPPTNGTGSRQWNIQTNQQSGWLALNAGQQYYVEILHKAGVGTNDNWGVGWLLDPTGTNTTPSGIVPGYVLSRYYPPLLSSIPGTLYTANLLALPGVSSDGVGSATLRVSADGTQAVLNYSVTNLLGSPTAKAIDSDPYLTNPSELIYDISAAHAQANGSYNWTIRATGTLQPADILEIIAEGKASINIESTFPGEQLSGHFTAANGTQTFTPPPPPGTWADDHSDPNAAARFLTQATFGASSNDIATVQSLGYSNWIVAEMALPGSHTLTNILANPYSDPTDLYQSTIWFNSWWQQSITAPDQLRQRVAFALSEIMVVSENGVLQNNALALGSYYDTLVDNCFGNFRTLLKTVTLAPAMGLYLNVQGNTAGSEITGLHADENYAREVQQLFSIGLNRLWPDGSLILNAGGNLVPTYNQNVVMGFAATFTGWTYYQTNQANGRLPSNFYPPSNYTNSMVLVPSHHDMNSKLLLDNVVLPPAQGLQASSTNVAYDNYGLHDLDAAMDSLFNNPNVGPFICRELIQRLVTSNPSRGYLYRVVQVFNNDGTGTRGNLAAVISAILLDYEARSPIFIGQPSYGKQREPLARATALARAFPAPAPINGNYSENGDRPITVVTSSPHRLNSGDVVYLTFTDTSGNAVPLAQGYGITYSNATTFSVTSPNLLAGTYGQTNGIITVALSGHGLTVGNPLYLTFTTGGVSNGVYQTATVIDSSHITVTNSDLVTRYGNCLMPKLSVGGYTQTTTNIVISTTGPHGLVAGNTVFINFTSGTAADGTYTVTAVSNATHFTIVSPTSASQNDNSLSVYPLVPPILVRSGTVVVRQNTWNMGYTDTSTSASLSQSPLRSPTVFNYFFPDYQFPGALASAGLTTPEFQLTSDTGVALQMNFLEGAILNNTGNTNGLSSFIGGGGAIVLDIGSWMTTNYTSAAGVPTLVSNLNSLLAAGQLPSAASSYIVSYVTNTTNFPYTVPTPTQGQMRDRVRAAIHLIISSPDFTIQK